MIIECWTIVIILTAISFIFLRARRKYYAFGILPLILIPLLHIAGSPISRLVFRLFGFPALQVHIAIDIFTLVLSCIILALFASAIQNRRSRSVFLLICGIYNLILSCILIFNLL